MIWSGWDDRSEPLADDLRALLQETLQVTRPRTPPVDETAATMRPAQLPPAARQALVAVVGAAEVRDDSPTRLRHAGGKSTTDLVRRRSGDAGDAPDAVVYPVNHDEVLGVLRTCAEHRVAVVPFGGGTSVVGGVEPVRAGFAAVIALDLRRLDHLVALDDVSMTATLEAGLRTPEAEELLAARGLTLGHLPESYAHASIGGYAATRSSGQASSGYGRFDDLVLGLRVATPRGSLRLGRAPSSAAGPDLRQLVLGSEGTLGVITEVTATVRARPEVVVDEAWLFPDFAAGVLAFRRLAQAGILPTITRLSDEAETGVDRLMGGAGGDPSGDPGGCLAVVGYEGPASVVAARRELATAVLAGAGGSALPSPAGERWRARRFRGPALRDAVLDVGVLAETVETATSWSHLASLHAQVRDALATALAGQGTPALVWCHVSHVYPAGASLYFTVAAAQADDPVAQWRRAKEAANAAIAAAGATITHHHGVGLDHRGGMVEEVGELGVEVLRAVKATLDPAGVLNPGKLIPPEG
jgi:alkyldihydroxyacetonephosphate synthase